MERKNLKSPFNTNKKLILAIPIILIGIVACSSGLDSEALKTAKEFYSTRILECNGRYYVQGNSITELEGLQYNVNPNSLSEADRKNGIEWKGTISFGARIYRPLKNNKVWGEFGEWKSNPNPLDLAPNRIHGNVISLMKKNGDWHIENIPDKNPKGVRGIINSMVLGQLILPEMNITCNDLPK